MIVRDGIILSSFIALVTASNGCHQNMRTSPAAAAPDSVIGIISLTGTEFEQHLVLRAASGNTSLSAEQPDSAALSRMGGVEVLVVGKKSPSNFRVTRFTALSVAGSPVVDGFLRADGSRLVLETANGTVPLGNPPPAFRNMVAARIWIAGPLDKGPNSYGVIVPAP